MIEFEPEELRVASEWHGGQASMLYAISSTGALSRGAESYRPRVDCDTCAGRGWTSPSEPCGACRDARMTDSQWLSHLASKLADEANESAEHAREQGLHDDGATLDDIADKCRAAIVKLGGAS